MVREARRVGPLRTNSENSANGAAVAALDVLAHLDVTPSVEQRIQQCLELAVKRCGSAAALARELGVTPPTVSQWRARKKNPDAVNLIRIQDLACEEEVGAINWRLNK